MKRHAANREKRFANHICDKDLYLEYIKNTFKKTNNPIKKQVKEWSRLFHQRKCMDGK